MIERPALAPEPTIGVLEITSSGPAHRLYSDDPLLPWLAPATDTQAMRARFAELITDTAVTACASWVLTINPGVCFRR